MVFVEPRGEVAADRLSWLLAVIRAKAVGNELQVLLQVFLRPRHADELHEAIEGAEGPARALLERLAVEDPMEDDEPETVRARLVVNIVGPAAERLGEILAWIAWKAEVAGKHLEDRDGFTPEQRFFIGFAQWACENQRPENLRMSAITNPHSPGQYRINGVAVNMPEFQQAFHCKEGQPMVAGTRCMVW